MVNIEELFKINGDVSLKESSDTSLKEMGNSLKESGDNKCQCPSGFKGDGTKTCEDVDECKEKKLCQCPECSCKNTYGTCMFGTVTNWDNITRLRNLRFYVT